MQKENEALACPGIYNICSVLQKHLEVQKWWTLTCQPQNKSLEEGRKGGMEGGMEGKGKKRKRGKPAFVGLFVSSSWMENITVSPNISTQKPNQNLGTIVPLSIIISLKKEVEFLNFLPQSTHNCIVLAWGSAIPLAPQSRTHSAKGWARSARGKTF